MVVGGNRGLRFGLSLAQLQFPSNPMPVQSLLRWLLSSLCWLHKLVCVRVGVLGGESWGYVKTHSLLVRVGTQCSEVVSSSRVCVCVWGGGQVGPYPLGSWERRAVSFPQGAHQPPLPALASCGSALLFGLAAAARKLLGCPPGVDASGSCE